MNRPLLFGIIGATVVAFSVGTEILTKDDVPSFPQPEDQVATEGPMAAIDKARSDDS